MWLPVIKHSVQQYVRDAGSRVVDFSTIMSEEFEMEIPDVVRVQHTVFGCTCGHHKSTRYHNGLCARYNTCPSEDSETSPWITGQRLSPRQRQFLGLRRKLTSSFNFILSTFLILLLFGTAVGQGTDGSFIQEINVEEELPAGTVIGVIGEGVQGNAPPPYLQIIFTGQSGVAQDLNINKDSGVISARRKLDRERRSSYSFAALSKVTSMVVQVTINVTDINDHSPAFPNDTLNINLSEYTPKDTKIKLSSAVDRDIGINNTQRYEIVSGNIGNAFRVSSKRAGSNILLVDLVVNNVLDHEITPAYTLVILAYDGGNPPRNGTLRVNIKIIDVNDYIPVFVQSHYFAEVLENATVGVSVLEVSASDEDSGQNGNIRYSINRQQSDPQEHFVIDPVSGVIRVNKPLDFESKAEYEIIVIARDNGTQPREGSAVVSIQLININEQPAQINLVFLTAGNKSGHISENAAPGDYVARISVSDPDAPGEYNAHVNVSLTGGDGHFVLTTRDSVVYLMVVDKPLDREKKPFYNLTITAVDAGIPPLYASLSITIWVEDVNDNSPKFSKLLYTAEIPEAAFPGVSVLQVSATDADAGDNSLITYSLLSTPDTQSDWFQIDSRTGLITTRSNVDCEINSQPKVTVVATDSGSPPRTGNVTVIITVRDFNDNQPMFDQSYYSVTIPENTTINSCFITVRATDPDCGVNAQVSYSIPTNLGFDVPSEFVIGNGTGQICVEQELDYEEKNAYEFTVMATDRGGLNAKAMVKIKVTDINDNRPVFYPAIYSVNVNENTPVDIPIITVQASDPDSGVFGKITYRLTSQDTEGFVIHPDSGVISLNRTLGRWERVIQLEVNAFDGLGLAAPSSATVTVSVTGANYQPPEFDMTTYNFAVDEDASADRSIGVVQASRASSGSAGMKYSIAAGDPQNFFRIDETSGVLFTNRPLDHDKYPSLLLNIQANVGSPPVFGTAQVNVTIKDINDNTPKFSVPQLEIPVKEDASVPSTVYVVHATDKDSGPNGTVRFQLSVNPGRFFQINAVTGEITLAKALDYETKKEFNLVVNARDQGTPPRDASIDFQVTVLDVNDNDPEFSKPTYNFTVSENVAINTQFAQMNATDKDSGNNAQITYQLDPAVQSPKFGIFPVDGHLYIREPLDREMKSLYMLKIIAMDNGNPTRSTTTNVRIEVLDANDNSPVFTEPSYTFYLLENQTSGTTVGYVSANDRDSGEMADLRYSLKSNSQYFEINHYTGEILTKKILDREKLEETKFTVHVTDRGEPPEGADCSVRVIIQDINDNAPMFERSGTYVEGVAENQPKGTLVTQIVAVDPDSGENGTVTYYLAKQGDLLALNYFTIHPKTGWIQTEEVLDFETRNSFTLHVMASDSGNPPMVSPLLVQVEVQDDNDEAPIFTSHNVTFNVVENSPLGSIVGKVSASDRDSGENGRISYYISGGNVFSAFDVNISTGEIFTVREIDYEESSSHSLGIKAVDNNVLNPKSSTVKVIINVQDVNDNSPEFDTDPVVLQVRENLLVDSYVYKFIATDPDSGYNGQVDYSIVSQSPPGPFFRVHKNSGILSTQVILDHEEAEVVSLVVRARDKARDNQKRFETTVTVVIFIIDANDNWPKFEDRADNYERHVFEDEPVGFPIMLIVANDADSNTNSSGNNQVRYTIVSGNGEERFNLNPNTGLLEISYPLDRETQSVYHLNISAYDNGTPRRTTHKRVTIHVIDVNDNAPHFEKLVYHAEVAENAQPAVVTAVRASDLDTGENGKLTYLIPRGIAEDKFTVDSRTGVMRTTGELDRENQSSYVITVYVRDGGYPAHYDTATVIVNVTDINDHGPVFQIPTVYLTVPENAGMSVIHTMVAADADSGRYGEITYSLSAGDVNRKFRINSQTGELSCDGLDREAVSQYRLTVKALDGGTPPRSGQCEVVVTVSDQNDNNPIFNKPSYKATIPENVQMGKMVLQITALDADDGVNGNVSYSLGNDTEGLFRIDSVNGRITTTGTFDREKKSEYTFQVNATDGGLDGPRYGVALVNINVSDINDNPPVFQTVPYQVTISQDHQPNQYITTLSAVDKDEGNNGQVSYSFIPDSSGQSLRYFSIEAGSGVVRTTRVLDSDALGYHNLQVLATDNGSPASLSSTGVLEITVGNTAGLAAVQFSNLTYNINLSESSTRGTRVTTVQARLTSGSGTVTYSFANGNEDGTFEIHPTSGVISVREASHLDFEGNPRVRLIVVASASGAYGYTTVWVNLRDSNDNAPSFGQDRYTSSVWEGHPRGTYVTQVTAIDADQGTNARVRYNIIGGNTDNAFSIEPAYSGIVKTNIILDREVHPMYKLEIEAVDHGSPSLSSTCTLKISVVDVNDNKPYLPPVDPITVPEGLEVGSLIETLFASDQDLNPTLTYYFLSDGNPGDTFSIDKYSGKITLAKKLDYEKRHRYELKVRAWDGVHQDKTTVVIAVVDENDNAPQFTQQSYQVTLPEMTGANQVVFTVNATDADSGANSNITYSMDIAPVDGFYINSKTGAIYTNKNITYSSAQPVIQLVVKATDSGQPVRSSVVAIRIQVTDVNNYRPQFVEADYSALLREDEPRGTPVIKVSATDKDSSRRNHNIDYKIVRGNTGGAFAINRQTGQVRLNSELDREIKGKYSLEIMAKDRGTPPKNSTKTVKIVIEDVNDRPPVFERSQYFIQLNESYPSNHVFLIVRARDDDIRENGRVTYDISSGDDDQVFTIDSITGAIKVSPASQLDYEKNSVHKLVIQASDCEKCPKGEPRLSAFATVIVNVTDINEFSPVFPGLRYLVSVPESQQAGKVVFLAYAYDRDGGEFGQVVYSISGNTTGFQIDPVTGSVTTTQVFDYEERTNYAFQVSASDRGGRNTTVPVIVLVESVDEFAPVFDEPIYKFTVPGNAKTGDKIGFVHASDLDGGIHHRVVYYLKTEQDYFAVNRSSGEVYVKKTFHEDVERQKRETRALISRTKRALEIDQVVLDVVASSGQLTKEVIVNVTVDRTCEGCAYVAASVDKGLNGTPLVLVIVFAIVVIVLLVVIAFILLRRHYTKQPPPNDGMFEPTEIAPPRVLPQNGHPPPYSDIHRYNINNNIHLGHTTTTSDMSDHSQHSASSGHGSVEDGEDEDEEIRMINSNNLLQTSPNRGVIMPDSGIQADDNVSEPSVQNHQEYLARLGIDTSRIKVKPKPQTIGHSVESMHHFSDEGGGEGDGMDFGSVNYEKMTDLETDDELAMIENSKDYGFCDSDPQHAGSLSSVINSEEEYSGSYNWDYLLDWGPQYQPLADVFAEIARLKDDSVQPKKQPVHQVPQRQTTAQLNPPVRMIPPPIITGAPPKPLSQQLMGRSAHSSPSSGKTVNSRSSAVTASLPRSPISHESSFTSPALTPSFTPSLSPLATGSPSSYVTPPMGGGSSHHGSSGPTTPHEKGYSHRPTGMTISASESEQELRI